MDGLGTSSNLPSDSSSIRRSEKNGPGNDKDLDFIAETAMSACLSGGWSRGDVPSAVIGPFKNKELPFIEARATKINHEGVHGCRCSAIDDWSHRNPSIYYSPDESSIT